MIKLIIPGVPLSWKAPYVGTKGAFSPRTGVMHELQRIIRAEYEGPFFTDAVGCSLVFVMPIPKSVSKKRKALMLENKVRPTTRPDRTNLAKFAEDLLIGIVFCDDSIIVEGPVEKRYGETPQTIVHIWKIE